MSRTGLVFNFFFPAFECSNPVSNCADRQCLFPFYIHQLFMDLSCISAIFPRSENKVSLVFMAYFLPVVLLCFAKNWFLNNEIMSLLLLFFICYMKACAFDDYSHF